MWYIKKSHSHSKSDWVNVCVMNFLATQAPMEIDYNLSFVLLHACHEERLYKYALTLFLLL